MKNKIVAAMLAFIGGTFGLHKFYLRDPGGGIFYIFLMIMTSRFFPVTTILGFFEGMRYLMMSPEEFDSKYNRRYFKDRPSSRYRKRKDRRTIEEYSPAKRTTRKPRIKSNPFKKSGIKKYKDYDIEEAIEDFKKGLKIEPDDIALHFNLACAYSLLEDKDEAFSYLQKAVELGLNDFEKIEKHDDLAFLRIQPEFEAFRKNGYALPRQKPKEASESEKVQQPVQSAAAPTDDVLLAQLNRLMELRKKGVLTEKEYSMERKKILRTQ